MEHTHYSKLVKDIFKVDIMISMGCEVGSPYIGKEFDENWKLADPTGKDDALFRKIIKKIEDKIKKLSY